MPGVEFQIFHYLNLFDDQNLTNTNEVRFDIQK